MKKRSDDRQKMFMQLACDIAKKGVGSASPNPIVGAVIVKGGKIVGKGFHKKPGQAHAEVNALRQAASNAKGADLYVTLEPCCHDGKTPPCADAIARAGISKVFIGTRDPNPLVNGKGVRALKRAGISVKEGLLKEECVALNQTYNKYIVEGLPFVTAKVALTLDGKIATSTGQSKWITNVKCRQFVHELRSRSDAVMVGAGTVRSDDPKLDVRIKGYRGKMPKAIVVDENLDVPRSAALLRRRRGELIFITTSKAPSARVRWLERAGHDVIVCKKTSKGHVDVKDALKELGNRGISSVLLEGGGELFSSFVNGGRIDRIVACIAPKLIGGVGRDFLPEFSAKSLNKAIVLSDVEFKTFDDNVVMQGLITKA